MGQIIWMVQTVGRAPVYEGVYGLTITVDGLFFLSRRGCTDAGAWRSRRGFEKAAREERMLKRLMHAKTSANHLESLRCGYRGGLVFEAHRLLYHST